MKLLIFGGCGYIGTEFVKLCLSKNHEVIVIDDQWFGNQLHSHAKLTVMKRNISTIEVHDLIQIKADVCVFLAGLSNDPMADFSPYLNFKENISNPIYLAYISKLSGIKRFVMASSCSVYGFSEDKLLKETDDISCEYPYGISKIVSEKGLLDLADANFTVICMRKGTVCGFSDKMRLDLVMNAMTKDAYHTGIIHVNNPEIYRPILSIKDACQAYYLALSNGVSGCYNIASENTTIGDLAKTIQSIISKDHDMDVKIEYKQTTNEKRNYRVSIDKAKVMLGYNPLETIKSIAESLSQHIGEINCSNDNFYNIKTFMKMLSGDTQL